MFDDEIAAQQRTRIRRNFGSGRASEIAGNPQKAWPGQTGRKERTERKRSRIRSQEKKEVRETKGVVEAMEDKRGWKPSLFFPYQIIDFAPAHFASFVLAHFASA